jgi:hypothetical protein
MLLGWECLECQEAYKIPPHLTPDQCKAPERCTNCGGKLFRRVDGIPGINAHPVYPDKPVTDPAPPPSLKKEDQAELEPDDWRLFDGEVDSAERHAVALVPGTWSIIGVINTNLDNDDWCAPSYKIKALVPQKEGSACIDTIDRGDWHQKPPMIGFKHSWTTAPLFVDMALPGKAVIEFSKSLPQGLIFQLLASRIR